MLGIVRQAVSVESNLAFSDYGRMHTEGHALRQSRWTPPFALNTSQLRRVLLVRCWRFCHNHSPIPEHLDWSKLNAEATARVQKKHKIRAESPLLQKQMHINHVRAVLCVGGYLQLQSALAWRSWRLGMNSVDVAESLGISPACARINLLRLKNIARQLGYDIGQPHHSRENARHSRALKKAWKRRKASLEATAA